MAQASEKLNIDSIKIGKWARFTRIRFEVRAGLWCGVFTTFTKMRYLSVEDPLIMQRQSSYDERATTEWRRMPPSCFPRPSRATVTDHGHATFVTLMDILTYPKEQLVVKAVSLAIARDGASGGVVWTVIINSDGVTRNFNPGDTLPLWHEEVEATNSLLDILNMASPEPMSM